MCCHLMRCNICKVLYLSKAVQWQQTLGLLAEVIFHFKTFELNATVTYPLLVSQRVNECHLYWKNNNNNNNHQYFHLTNMKRTKTQTNTFYAFRITDETNNIIKPDVEFTNFTVTRLHWSSKMKNCFLAPRKHFILSFVKVGSYRFVLSLCQHIWFCFIGSVSMLSVSQSFCYICRKTNDCLWTGNKSLWSVGIKHCGTVTVGLQWLRMKRCETWCSVELRELCRHRHGRVGKYELKLEEAKCLFTARQNVLLSFL